MDNVSQSVKNVKQKPAHISEPELDLYRPTAAESYTDEDGNELYQNCRYEYDKHGNLLPKKVFKRRHKDAGGKWVFNASGIRKVPFNLVEIVQSNGHFSELHFVEGEKDANTAKRLGLLATSIHTIPQDEWGQWGHIVKGRMAIIHEDNDQTGREKAAKTAQVFAKFANGVKIVRYTEMPESSDLTDWVNASPKHTLETLLERVEATPLFTPPAPTPAPTTQPQPAPRLPLDDAALNRWLSWKIDAALNIINSSAKGGLHAARLKAGNLLGGVVSGFGAGRFSDEDAFQAVWPVVKEKTATPKEAEQDLRDGIEHGKNAPISAMDMQAEFEEWKARHPLETRADALPPAHETKKTAKQVAGKAHVIRAALNQYAFALNELTDRIMVNGDPLTDEILSVIYCELVNTQPSCTTELLTHVIRAEAAQHRYHPVKDYLTGLKWNGANAIAKLASYFEDEDGVFGLYLRKWLIGAVAKAFSGKQNPVLVLVGEQGMGKGFLAKWICPVEKTYIESPIIPDNNDNKLRLTDRFVWEVSELGSTTRRADVDALKWFLTLESVVARRSYGRFDIEKPALASFIGTVNPDGAGFLMDATGNRRFRPVTLKRINRTYATACDITQIWAEAVDAYRRGETSDLHFADETALRESILPKSQVVNLMVELIEQEYAKLSDAAETYMDAAMSSADILQHIYNCGYHGRNSKADAMDLAQAMRFLGYEKKRVDGRWKYLGIVQV